ncbi:thiamine-phosphate synthase [Candidatus Methanoplasma termitum]|uniref:ThiE2 protein n=1 Tax=Candidatus Methanoplasma termitum TaxID=1577791 RepID=A0A0A7LAV3_9ARCH|nr:thiamine phosphate synthase [Candidatus Methanoplasma termitum]AIZ56204.1 thiamine-phosphate synthase [Candidatus Methanoplasma termitum]MCL2334408.1 thiamine phosphate synthase [Candidatus Methanoplasma sp.]
MIIAVTDRKISVRRDFLEQVEEIAGASPNMIILREKDLPEPDYRYLAVECARICSCYNVEFCVNTFVKTAALIGNGRIQISFGSLKAERDRLNDFKEIWVSVHSLKEAVDAERLGATHLIYGNVFETSCKPGLKGKGLMELAEISDTVNIPVFAVGGIDIINSRKVLETGCDGLCVRSLLMTSENPREKIGFLKRDLEERKRSKK